MAESSKTILNGNFIFKEGSESTVNCKFCGKEFKYHRSLTSLTYHLKSRHTFTNLSSPAAPSTTAPLCKQTVIKYFHKGPATEISDTKSQEITSALARWIAESGRPVNIVADDGLRDIIRIAASDPTYFLPCRRTIQKEINELYFTKKCERMKIVGDASTIAISCDYWTSTGNDSYLDLMCHLIDADWHLKSFTLGIYNFPDRHTSENVVGHIQHIANEWKCLEKISSIGTDNARNIVKAVSTLPYKHMPCLAHTIQLSINGAISELGIDTMLAKCQKIVGHFKHSPVNNTELYHHQALIDLPEESLIQHVMTRWNSMHDMISRLLKHKDAIIATLNEQEHKLKLLTEKEWDKLSKVADVLQVCKLASKQLGGDNYVSCSIIRPLLCHLNREFVPVEDDPKYIVHFKETFCQDLNKRIIKSFDEEWLLIASLLDPRFEHLCFVSNKERDLAWLALEDLINSLPISHTKKPDTEGSEEIPTKKPMFCLNLPPVEEVDDNSDDEVKRYQTENIPSIEADPLAWWRLHQSNYPRLSSLARKYLATTATTVPCERLFSVAGFIADKRRASLLPNNANILLSLHDWLKTEDFSA